MIEMDSRNVVYYVPEPPQGISELSSCLGPPWPLEGPQEHIKWQMLSLLVLCEVPPHTLCTVQGRTKPLWGLKQNWFGGPSKFV